MESRGAQGSPAGRQVEEARPGGTLIRARALCAFALVAAFAHGQKDVSLETLARALEGRLGVYARNAATGDKIAINADKSYPAGRISRLADDDGAATRPATPPEERASPRALADRVAQVHATWPRDPGFEPRRRLLCDADANRAAAALSPGAEVGGVATGLANAPGLAGYVSTPDGDIVFCIMTEDMRSAFTGATLLPEILEACVRRLAPPFPETPAHGAPGGLLLASLHERKQEPGIFAKPGSDLAVADLRRGAQKLTFRLGDTACLAVLGRPEVATRVTVQWWSPSDRAEGRTTAVLSGRKTGDLQFDVPLEKAGSWRIRASYGGAVVFDEMVFVTGK